MGYINDIALQIAHTDWGMQEHGTMIRGYVY